MNYGMIQLPYAEDALEPVISRRTIEFHYGKHLRTYVDNLARLTAGTALEGMDAEAVVCTAPEGPVLDNAGQVVNHVLYFLQFTPAPARRGPSGRLADAVMRDFGGIVPFRQAFGEAAVGLFGSGWAWLSADGEGRLHLTREPNGSNPLHAGLRPLLGFDVWEHAYYLDYQNRRAEHVERLWEIVDWEVVERRY